MAPYKTKETKSLIASKKWCFRSLLSDSKNLFPCSAQNQKGHTWNEGKYIYRINLEYPFRLLKLLVCNQNELLKEILKENTFEITEYVSTDQ